MMQDIDLRGIIPAIVTPMTNEGELDLAALKRYVRWLADQGPVAVAVNVDTGEGPHLTADEKRLTLETVAEAVDLPLILFQLQPVLCGVPYTTETLHKLITIPTVAAIKEASFDAMRFLQVKAALESASRKIIFLTGNDNFICESFILGAEGALLGFSTLGTREQVMMLEAVRRGDIDQARELGARLQPLADAIFAPPITDYRARTKEALKMLGILENTTVRPPLLPVSEAECETVQRALQRAELLSKPAYS